MSNVLTPKGRVSYPNVFKPKKNEQSGKDEYTMTLLFAPGESMAVLEAEARRAITEKWGAEPAKWPRPLKTPFRNQGDRVVVDKATSQTKLDPATGKALLQAGHVDGAVFITVKAYERPGVVDHNVKPIIDPAQFYSGCYAIAQVRATAFDKNGNRGVSFWMTNIQKVAEGEPLSGRPKPEEAFAPVAQAATGGLAGNLSSASDLFG